MKISSQPLRPSPYTAYRDPDTGKWHVAKQNQEEQNNNSSNGTNQNQDNG
ncbi:hypothetical protein IQ225_13840 [Synechocystis salina LEGE 06155]|nr:hypothetical protein [Synechocystis salina LEGE 06155]